MKRADDELDARRSAAVSLERESGPPAARLNLKALRLAVHGWWFGNPLVYKPGATDLCAVARELASAGVASGALVLDDMPEAGAVDDGLVHAVLIVRPSIPRAPLGMAVAQTVAEVAQAALDCPCAVRGRWEVVLGPSDQPIGPLCFVSIEEHEGVSLLDLRVAFDRLYAAGQAHEKPTALFARADWHEVFLARALHALDGCLRGLLVA